MFLTFWKHKLLNEVQISKQLRCKSANRSIQYKQQHIYLGYSGNSQTTKHCNALKMMYIISGLKVTDYVDEYCKSMLFITNG